MADLTKNIITQLYDGDDKQVASLVQQALDSGMTASEVLSGGLICGMDEVGRDFKGGELFIPEVLLAARAMRAGMNIIRPLLSKSDIPTTGKYLIGTVRGDLHDIGKNLVKMMLEGAGFEIIDLGTDVSAETFVSAVRENQPDILGMSALLTTTMPEMKVIINALEAAGLRDSVKIMVGGAPLTDNFAKTIGADAYSPEAATAVDSARYLSRQIRG